MIGDIMREIKFRVRKGNKILGYEKLTLQGWMFRLVSIDIWSYGTFVTENNLERDQYTGLKDKYEGDLLLEKSEHYEDEVWEIFWNKEEVRFDVRDKNGHPYSFRLVCDDPESHGWWQDFPVIGNIHSDPKPLETQ